ncbi:hypothetical protein NPIL_641251 [Nephila pilipes]|uniref:C2H2-type domain-containing protein n=1 Tax=Nephila pilipes TaxID=299642 RepID=A0A8X6PNS0_NEPPI|nr:hypothetical protein NPIL_641251 [Nephila pilipes]
MALFRAKYISFDRRNFDSESNQNMVGAIVCQCSDFVMCDNSYTVMSGMVDCVNDFSVAESDFVCPDYIQSFRYKYNLKSHGYKFHYNNTILNESLGNQCANYWNMTESNFEGPDCLKTFTNRYNLKRHANKLHSNNTALIDSLKND